MTKPLAPSFSTGILSAFVFLLLVGCGASNKNTGEEGPDASTRADAAATSPVSDASPAKDAALAKDTKPSVTSASDTAQPSTAVPDARSEAKDTGREAAPISTDTLASADSASPSTDTVVRADTTPRTDTQAPDGLGKGSDGAACNPNGTPATLVHLTPQELQAILASAEDPFLINVKGATIANIPGTDAVLANNVPGIEALVKNDLCADIVLYCRTGAASKTAGTQLIAKGYQRVRDLAGGITAWSAAGYPTE